jgi:hypothetical protein
VKIITKLKTRLINLESKKYRILRIAGPRSFINILGSWGILKGSSLLAKTGTNAADENFQE